MDVYLYLKLEIEKQIENKHGLMTHPVDDV